MSLAAPNWEQEQIGRVSQITVPAWLVVWGGLLVVAIGLRLGGLDAAPLAPDEAARALEARRIWRGSAEGYSSSPLLVNLLVLWGALFTFADGPVVAAALPHVRDRRRDVIVLARTKFASDVPRLRQLGVNAVVNDETEAGVALVREGLAAYEHGTGDEHAATVAAARSE